jgi:hypothetical protein
MFSALCVFEEEEKVSKHGKEVNRWVKVVDGVCVCVCEKSWFSAAASEWCWERQGGREGGRDPF